jgi:hypothetical protein
MHLTRHLYLLHAIAERCWQPDTNLGKRESYLASAIYEQTSNGLQFEQLRCAWIDTRSNAFLKPLA